MGRQTGDQRQLFYAFNLDDRIPEHHLLRRINPVVTRVLADLRLKLKPFYSEIGRPSIDPELMLRMLIVGYCYGIRFERKLCEEVELHLAYRWFCRLDLDDRVPDHSTFSVNRHGRFRDSDILRQLFEAVVRACMAAGLVKGEGFAVDASVMEADASRYHGKAPDEIDWSAPERQTRAVSEFLASLEDDDRQCRSQAAEGDLANRSLFGLDSEGQQARAVRLRAELSDRHRERGDRRCRGDAGSHLRRGSGDQDDDRAHRTTARSEARTPRWPIRPTEPASSLAGLSAPASRRTSRCGRRRKRDDGTFSRSDFTFDKEKNEYRCPNGKVLRTTGRVHDGRTILYRASKLDCDRCPLKARCCPNVPARKVPRDVNEEARDVARALMETPEFERVPR